MEFREPDMTYTSYSYADYLSWNIPEMVEVIKGKVFKMSAAPKRIHQKLSGKLFIKIGVFLESKNCEVYVVCSYGKSQSNYEYYTQIAGQKGWEFLTGDKEMYQKVMIGLINNENHLKDLKNRVYCDLEKITVEYWKSKFYNENNFDYSKYLNFVSAY